MKPHYDRLILSLTDVELERFVRQWIESKKATYFEVTRFSGPGDNGRDVVGFFSKERHEGVWDNYQCKQYGKTLPTDTAIIEIGKILYYAHLGEFTPPNAYYFVAPRGVNRNLEKLIFKPTEFKNKLLSDWDKYCSSNIVENKTITLTPELRNFIEQYDFAKISRRNIDDILGDSEIQSVMFDWFGADPGPAPSGIVPENIAIGELNYVEQLLEVYSESEKKSIVNYEDLNNFPRHKEHLSIQRERFYHADAFRRFYRDNTSEETIMNFENEIFYGICESCRKKYQSSLERVNQVMLDAASLQPVGPIAHYARIPVKQGICHHFANEKKIKWSL